MRSHDGRVVSNFLVWLLFSTESDPVNLGNPTEWNIRELVTTLETLLGRALPATVHPLPTDDPKVRQPDIIIRARTLLGWEPTIDLATGLRETLGYFQQHSR